MPSQHLSFKPCDEFSDAQAEAFGLAGVPTAVTGLISALRLQDQSWASVAGALIDLLRRHAAGLSIAIARDELDAAFRSGATTGPRTEVVTGSVGLARASVWEGIVIGVQRAPRPLALVLRGSDERQTVFGMFIGQAVAAFGSHGVRVRAWPVGGVVRDVSGSSVVEGVEEESIMDAKGKRSFCETASLLSSSAAVLELRLPSTENGLSSEFPDCASSLLRERTLRAVWTERCKNPTWVSARVAEAASDALRLVDIDMFGTDQPTVLLSLIGKQSGYAHLISTGDVVLLHAPTVTPTGVSFDLGFDENTVVFAMKCEAASVALNQAKKSQKVLKAPPLKRPRVNVVNSPLGRDETESIGETLAALQSRVTCEDLLELRRPSLQPEFDMLAIARASPRVPAMTQREDGFSCSLSLADGVTVEFAKNSSDEVAQIVAGHVLWLRGLKTFAKPGVWKCETFTNVSMLPGALCSPFMRFIVSANVLTDVAAPRPGTVSVDVVIDSASAENEDPSVHLCVSNYSVAVETRRESVPVSIRNSFVLSHLLGTSVAEFWFGNNAHFRSRRLSSLVGSRYRLSVAMSAKPEGSFVNECAALSRVQGTDMAV